MERVLGRKLLSTEDVHPVFGVILIGRPPASLPTVRSDRASADQDQFHRIIMARTGTAYATSHRARIL